MYGRQSVLVGCIMATAALIILSTGASEEYGGVVVHVELERQEESVPAGYDSWDKVTSFARTGERYYWGPSGWIIVQRTDGSLVRCRNEFTRARYLSRVSILQSRSGEWFVTSVERDPQGDGLYEPEGLDPKPPSDMTAIPVLSTGSSESTEALDGRLPGTSTEVEYGATPPVRDDQYNDPYEGIYY